MGNISLPVNKTDSADKASGRSIYVADMKLQGMLYGRTFRSDRPYARILKIKIPDLPKGYYIIDKNDIPGTNIVKILTDDWTYFAEDTVNFIGEPILLVVGPDKKVINEIFNEIKIEYQNLDPVLTIEDAEKHGKKQAEYELKKGTSTDNFKDAVEIFEQEYETGYQEHIYLEPQGVLATFEDDVVTVYGTMQCPYYIKRDIVELLEFPEDKVRIVNTVTGGGFGGKEEFPSIPAGHAALASYKTGKPVQIIYERSEDIICTTKRHPSKIKIRTALDKNKKIISTDVEIKLNGGAYTGLSPVVLQRAMFASSGVYNLENMYIKGVVYTTNTVPTGAFRGFGAPQAFYAIENHMHHLAVHLGLNPVDFKKEYMVKKGDKTSTNGTFRQDIKLPEIIDKITGVSDYYKKYEKYKNDRSYRGIGISLYFHGCGFTGSGEKDIIKATVQMKKSRDKKVEILIANVDMGQGLLTSFRKIAAEVLELKYDEITFNNPDTFKVPDSGPTVASRSTMIVGKLIHDAALEMKERWNEEEFMVEKHYRQPDYMEWDQSTLQGDAYPTYSWGAQAVEVEIDKVTYEVKIKRIWTVHDIGKAIDERIIKGQVEGGITQGIGYAYMEVMNSKNGKLMQTNVTDYIIPTSMDFPETESYLIDNPFSEGPFGAKGAGELPLIGSAPAVTAAIQNAIQKPVLKIPVRPEDIMKLVNQ